ncbi:MAG: DUF502 domain-containing protein [Algiphilus sp.]
MNPSTLLKTFLSGLAISLPIVVTIAVIVWLFVAAESVMGSAIQLILPQGAYITGMGLVTGLVVIFGVGLATRVLLFQSLVDAFERLLNRIPLVKTLYGAARDLMELFSRQGQDAKFSKMVAVAWPGVPLRLFGFITVEDFSRLDLEVAEDEVAVYLPLSYQIGGYMALIPRQYLEPVDMSLEEGMRFVVTAGMSRPQAHAAAQPDAPAKDATS